MKGGFTKRAPTVGAILLATFLGAMEATIVATAMPTIARDLGGLSLYGWVGAAYLLASTVAVPFYGKLSDIYGRKPVLLFGLGTFLAGSVACGISNSIYVLIAARAIQGLGAGAVQPVSMTIIGDLFTIDERPRIQGLFGAVWGAAAVLGPLLGALLVATLGWRWVFWINLPVGTAASVLLSRVYFDRPAEERPKPQIDVLGALLLGAAAICILVGAGGRSVSSWPLLVLAIVMLVLFVVVERRAPEPVVPLKLLADPDIALALVSTILLGAAMGGSVNYLPLYVQGVLGKGPGAAGGAITPMLIGWPLASVLTGRVLKRTGPRLPVLLGSVAAAMGTAICLWAANHATAYLLYLSMFVLGVGMGLTTTALVVTLQTNAPYHERGVVTALTMFCRLLGSALGVGVVGAVLVRGLARTLDEKRIAALLDPDARRTGLTLDDEALTALARSFSPLWWTLAGITLANLVMIAFVYHPKKHEPAEAQ
ncbi:MAG: MDR family MFS transporter [Polyangiaceae bacterium]